MPTTAVTGNADKPTPGVKPKKQTVSAQLASTVGLPFTAAGVALTLAGSPEAGQIWPLEPAEEQQLANALVTALGNNDRITAALEKASGGIAMAALLMAVGQIMAPRVLATQALIAEKRKANEYARIIAESAQQQQPGNGTAHPTPAGGGAPESSDRPGNATDAGEWRRPPNGIAEIAGPQFAG